MNMVFIRTGLFLLAAVSPLLTFASLWQVKEWRIDRLCEHFRAEGFWRQVKGILRPGIIGLGIVALIVSPWKAQTADALLCVLALASTAQIIRKKQRYPVWTKKAMVLIAMALTVDVLISLLLLHTMVPLPSLVLSILILFQPDVTFVSWLLFHPVDITAKHRIMQKAKALRSQYENALVIGITGSVGKTTTKELIAHVLKKNIILFTPAYVNSEMGVSQWLLRELPKYKTDKELIIIVEMGAYRTGEIKRLCDITKPEMGVITFIGSQHVALFGSQEKLCSAKAELIESLPEDGTAFLNGDNALCANLKSNTQANAITVGTGGHADLEAFEIEETGAGIRFRAGDTRFDVPLHGTHNVTNVLLAIAVAKQLTLKPEAIAARLKSFTPPSNTFAIRSERGVTILDDTHNASPESFRAAIAWAKSQPMEQKVLMTPGLIELGTQEQSIHRELGSQASGIFSRVIFTQKTYLPMFQEGFSGTVEFLSKSTSSVDGDSLLVCIGRVSPASIQTLLP